MEEADKLPLKRVELSLTKFNEVAIPHHLDLLRQHKANIIKYEELGEAGRVRAEQARARRAAAQLRALLQEVDALRGRVRDADRPRFDALTQRARDTTLRAIVDYLGVIEQSCRALVSERRRGPRGTSPMAISRSPAAGPPAAASAVSTDSVGLVAHAQRPALDADVDTGSVEQLPDDTPQIQLYGDDQGAALQEREALLRGWAELQAEVRALHDVWQHAQAAALAQRAQVAVATSHVEAAADNVSAARAHLASAERLRAGAVAAGGAMLGALAGGPVGLAVGAKAGAAAALAGSLLGFLGARLFAHSKPASSTPPMQEHKED